jgi:hypothetical protein
VIQQGRAFERVAQRYAIGDRLLENRDVTR